MKGVNIRETRTLEQAFARNDFGYLTLDEHKVFDKALNEIKNSELYNKVGKDIEDKANELVETKCKPEWNRISEEMKPIGEKVNELEKEKAEAPTSDQWTEEKEEELKWLHKQLSDLTNEYQKVTDEANAELNEYKEERISQEQWACFFLEDDEYKLIGKRVGWILPTEDKE